jgi:ArsR family transcriptional regulator
MHSSQRARERAADAAEVLRICAHPYRLILLCLLEHEALSVMALMARTGLSQPTVSQHLARLREANIAVASRRSKMMYYRLNERHSSGELKAVVRTFCNELAADAGQSSRRPRNR